MKYMTDARADCLRVIPLGSSVRTPPKHEQVRCWWETEPTIVLMKQGSWYGVN